MDIIILGFIDKTKNNDLEIISIEHPVQLLDEHHILDNGEIKQFDYLIINNLSFLISDEKELLLCENKVPITNFYLQTNVEHIYYVEGHNIDVALSHLKFGDL